MTTYKEAYKRFNMLFEPEVNEILTEIDHLATLQEDGWLTEGHRRRWDELNHRLATIELVVAELTILTTDKQRR